MTDSDIIAAAVRDQKVKMAHRATNPDGSWRDPTPAELETAAKSELAAEIGFLLAQEDIARALLEREDDFDLTTGSTTLTQGLQYAFDADWDYIVSAAIGSSRRPVELMTNREEFSRWWYESYGESSVSDDTVKMIQWDPNDNNTPTFLLSPGRGSDSTLYVTYRKKVTKFSADVLNAGDHFIVLEGLKNRLSGGAFEVGYQKSLLLLKQRAAPILHRPTAMRRDPRVERLASALRSEYGGGVNEPSHFYRRP